MARLAVLALAFALILSQRAKGCSREPVPPTRPQGTPYSAVLIILDDVGRIEMPLMPQSLGALALQGMDFQRAYSWTVCCPSRLAMTYGRYSRREGIGDVEFNGQTARIPLDRVALPELLGVNGYRTCLVGKWHLGRSPWQGEMDQITSGPHGAGYQEWKAGFASGLGIGGGYYLWECVTDGDQATGSGRCTTYATDGQAQAFLDWWSNTSGKKFAVLSWAAAHSPYQAPPGYIGSPSIRANYQNMITYLDGKLAQVLAGIDLQTTFVFVVGDNGTPDEARPVGTPSGYWKGTTFEGGVKVPLLVAGPGISVGTNERVVSLADIPRTICELLVVSVPAGFEDSQSFANALGGWTGSAPRAFAFSERYNTGGGVQPAGYDDQAIIETQTTFGAIQLKLKLRRVDMDGPGPLPYQDFVYDLVTDPFELSPGDPSTLPTPLRDRLYAELASLPARQ